MKPEYHFSSVGILSKRSGDCLADTLHKLYTFLSTRHINVLCDSKAAAYLPLEAHPIEAMQGQIDLAIVVGGDGTFLGAARLLSSLKIPVVGINLGRLGFLVDVSPQDLDQQLEPILRGEGEPEARYLLSARVMRNGACIGAGDAMNDVILHVRNDVRMIEFETRVDGQFMNRQRADGMVIATPTGSTAYALSGGGPILHPSLNVIVLVPICPHTLNHRPIVVTNKSTVEIIFSPESRGEARVSFDGQENVDLLPGDTIVIHRKRHYLQLLHPQGHDYYHVLREKLGWSNAL